MCFYLYSLCLYILDSVFIIICYYNMHNLGVPEAQDVCCGQLIW